MKIEWMTEKQTDYRNKYIPITPIDAVDFLDKLINGKTEYNISNLQNIKITLNVWLSILIMKMDNGCICYLMCGDHVIGDINNIENVKNLIKYFVVED